MDGSTFTIKTFNPFESRFPKRKVLDIGTLHLIKELRNHGYKVVVLPDDRKPVEYLFRKGYDDIFNFALPFILTTWQDLPKEIVLSIISDWYKNIFFKSTRQSKNPPEITNNGIYVENFSGNMYNLNGKEFTPIQAAQALSQISHTQLSYGQAFSAKSPYEDLPIPIYREHSPLIVGWAKMNVDANGISVEDSQIVDLSTWNDVKAGKLLGLSMAGIATKSVCNICDDSYVDCIHIAGNFYNQVECYNTIQEAIFVECSLVKAPAYTECLINIVTNQK